MILTEKEARYKFCPKAIAKYREMNPLYNHVMNNIYPANGHQVCMRENAANCKEEWPIEHRRGFCGLAGKPEVA